MDKFPTFFTNPTTEFFIGPGARFSKLPVITEPILKAVLFSTPDESFKRFESCTVTLSAKETKWT